MRNVFWLLVFSITVVCEDANADFSVHNAPIDQVNRFRRDGDPFTEFHSKMTLASRIFSGIALRIGLHDESVTGDEVVSELLNLKSVSLDDVASYDKAKVDQFVKDLVGLDVDPSDDLQRMEKKIMQMDSLRKQFEKITNPDETKLINDYMDKVKAFSGISMDFNFLVNLETYVATTVPQLDFIANGQTSTMSETKLNAFAEDLDRFSSLSGNITSILATLDGHKDLLRNKIFESTTVNDFHLFETFFNGNWEKTADDVRSQLNDQLNKVNGLAAQFTAAIPSIRVTKAIINSKRTPRTPSGFVDGLQDVFKLSNDVHDTWLPTVIDKYDKELIVSELQPLEQFGSNISDLDAKWKSVGGSEVIETISLVEELFNRSRSAIQDSEFNAMENKDPPSENRAFAKKMKDLVEGILKFREAFGAITAKVTIVGESEDMKQLVELIKFKDKIYFDNGRKVKDVARDMPKKEEVNKLIQVLKNIQPKMKDIEDTVKGISSLVDPLKSMANGIESFRGDIAAFVSHPTRNKFFQYFASLKTIKKELTSMSEAVTLLQTIRSMKFDANFQPKLAAVTDKIAGSIDDFKTLRAIPIAIKSTKTSRIDELIQLKSIEGPSKILGESVTVLDTVHKVLSMESEIERIMGEGWKVAGVLRLKQNREDLQIEWGSFSQLSTDIGALLAELHTVKSTLTAARRVHRQTGSLKDMAGKLTNLQSLADVNFDLKKKINLLRRIGGHSELENLMDSLTLLDLQFSAHRSALGSVAQEVGSIENVFGGNKTSDSSSGKPGDGKKGKSSKNRNSSGKFASGKNSGKDESDSQKNDWKIIIIIIVVLLVVSALGAAGGCWYHHTFKVFELELGGNETPSELEREKKQMAAKRRLDAMSTRTARAKTVVEEHFDMSQLSVSKRAMADEYKECVQVMMEDERLKKEKSGMEKKDQQRELVKATEKKMVALKESLGVKLAEDVEKYGKLEYKEQVARIEHGRLQLEADKGFDKDEVVSQKKKDFEELLMTPLAMCRETVGWKLVDGVWVPPQRQKEYCEKVKNMLLFFRPREECIEKNLDVTMILNPFYARLIEANAAVDKLNQSFNKMEYLAVKVAGTKVQVFDKYNVALSTGKHVNASWYRNKYGKGKLIVCAAPGLLNNTDNVEHMLWQENVQFTVTVDCMKYYECVNRKATSPYKFTLKNETFVEGVGKMKLMKQEILMKNGTEERTITNFHLMKMGESNRIFRNEQFRGMVKLILRRVARQEDKNTVFFDPEGHFWAGTLAGIELISSSLSNDGVVDAHVTTQLTHILSHRGHMFILPDQVMLMFYIAVDMFLEDHKQPMLTKEDLENLEKCYESEKDSQMKKELFGADRAKTLQYRDDRTTEELPSVEKKLGAKRKKTDTTTED